MRANRQENPEAIGVPVFRQASPPLACLVVIGYR